MTIQTHPPGYFHKVKDYREAHQTDLFTAAKRVKKLWLKGLVESLQCGPSPADPRLLSVLAVLIEEL